MTNKQRIFATDVGPSKFAGDQLQAQAQLYLIDTGPASNAADAPNTALMQNHLVYCHEQCLPSRPLTPEDLFVPRSLEFNARDPMESRALNSPPIDSNPSLR